MRNVSTLLKLAVRNLLRNPRRSILVVLTVAVGSAAVFLFDGFNAGIMNQYRENTIRARYGHGQIHTKGYRDQVYEKPWEHWIEDPERLIKQLRALPGVQFVFPRLEFFALLSKGNISLSGRGQGIDGPEEAQFFNSLNIEQGTNLSDQTEGILLGRGLARSLGAVPGDRVTVLANTIHGSINGVDLVVTGIFHTGAKEFDDAVFRIPLAAAQGLLDTQRVESVALGLHRLQDWEAVAHSVVAEHPELEAVPFAVLDRVYYQHAVDWLGSQFRVIKLIILFIVILGIFSTVSSSVLERKQEVGNLRANGESRSQVLGLFLSEGALYGLVGAVVGIIATWLLNATVLAHGILMPPSPGLTRQFHVFVELQPWSGVETVLLASACALVGTCIAAIRVVRMPIGEALRAT